MTRSLLTILVAAAIAACTAPAASAFNMTLSSAAPTSNVAVSSHTFTATANGAVLNVSDLTGVGNWFIVRTDANASHTGTLTINAWPTGLEFDEATFEAGQIVVSANNAAANYDEMADLIFKAPTTIATSTLTGADILFSAAAPVTLAASNVALNASSSLQAQSTINGTSSLTLGGAATNTDLTGPIGGTTPLTSIVHTTGSTKLRGDVTTTGAQSYAAVQALDAGGLNLTSNAGAVTFSGGITGAPNAVSISANALGLAAATSSLGSLDVQADSTNINSGSVITTGAQTYSGSVNIGGTTTLQTPALSIPVSTLDIASSSTLNVNGGGSIAATVADSGNLTKLGDGQLTLLGNNTSTGTMRVSGGALGIFGLQPGAPVVLGSGQLFGTGTLGAVTPGPGSTSLNPGGVSSPTIGTLKTKALTFSSLNTAALELVGDSHDQLDVTGAVTLADAALNLSVGGTPTPGASQVLINNDGADAISGTFVGLAEGATVTTGGFSFVVSYVGGDGNDFTIARTVAIMPPLENPPVVVIPKPSASDFKLSSSTIRINKTSGKGTGKLTCTLPAGTCALKGSVYVAGKKGLGKKIGSVSGSASAGKTGTLTIKLFNSGKKLIRSKGKIKSIAVMKLVVPAGTLEVTPKYTLKL